MTAVGMRYRVLCSDGRIRTATATADPDTFFTIPARVSVRGRTVTGSVSTLDADMWTYPGVTIPADAPAYMFAPFTYRKNHDALPAWSRPELREIDT
jgi:hypothetical protein